MPDEYRRGVTDADREWCEALGVPAGTSPEDALRLVVERERAAVVAHLLARQDAAIRRRPMMLTQRLENVTVGQILEAGDAAAAIRRGEHIREGAQDQTTHPDPSSAASE